MRNIPSRLEQLEERARRLDCLAMAERTGLDPNEILTEARALIRSNLAPEAALRELAQEIGQPYEDVLQEVLDLKVAVWGEGGIC